MARPRFYQRRHSLPKGHNPVRAALAVDAQRKLILDLHGTLRTITDMAQNSCRWRKACALVIAEDLETSHQLAQDFPQIGLAAAPACQALARDILNDRLHPDAIAGAEIYREEGAAA